VPGVWFRASRDQAAALWTLLAGPAQGSGYRAFGRHAKNPTPELPSGFEEVVHNG
jgi:hypothetical protein